MQERDAKVLNPANWFKMWTTQLNALSRGDAPKDRVWQLFMRVADAGRADVAFCNSMMLNWCHTSSEIEQVIRVMDEPHFFAQKSLFNALCREERFDDAALLLQRLNDTGASCYSDALDMFDGTTSFPSSWSCAMDATLSTDERSLEPSIFDPLLTSSIRRREKGGREMDFTRPVDYQSIVDTMKVRASSHSQRAGDI